MIAKALLKYRLWAEERPEGVNDQEARMHVLARAGFPLALAGHVGFLVIFWLQGITLLFLFNIFSVFIWAVLVWIFCVQNRYSKIGFAAGILVEIPAHGVLATIKPLPP